LIGAMTRPRVLIVEDEVLIALSLAGALSTHGYEVRTAGDGQQALQLVERFVPDVIITDYMMPRLDGAALIRRVRARPELRSTRLILVTAIDEARLARERLDYDAFVRKPFLEDEVVARVRHLLDPPAIS
jgi:CheY-like chemotaxis protein